MTSDETSKGTGRTRKNKNADEPTAKIIPIKGFRPQPASNQPRLDLPLHFTMTPEQIHKNILSECHMFMTSDSSLINPECVTKQVKFENPENYCWLTISEAVVEDECNEEMDLFSLVVLEIKIGKVYLFAEFGEQSNDYQQSIEERDWQRGEEALMKIAPLLGFCVKRGLIVED